MRIEHTKEELENVLSLLKDGDWHKGPHISVSCGVNERQIRHIAEVTAKLISGNDGYKRIDMATKDEISHHVASLRSRANKITMRADAIEHGDLCEQGDTCK